MSDFNDKNNGFNGSEDDFEGYNDPDDEFEEDDDFEPEYTVGYRKPPKHTQFKKGQSGNPRGRKKEPRHPAEFLAKGLSEKIKIRENGEIKEMKVMEAIAKKTIAMALQGNITIMKKLLDDKIIDPYLFKDALNHYNPDPDKKPKTPSPEIRLLVNKAKDNIRKIVERENRQGDTE